MAAGPANDRKRTMYISLMNLFMFVLPSSGFANLTNRKSGHRIGNLRFGGASERRRQREGEEPAQCRAHRSRAIYNTAGCSPPLDQQHLLLVARNEPLSGRAPAAIVAPKIGRASCRERV